MPINIRRVLWAALAMQLLVLYNIKAGSPAEGEQRDSAAALAESGRNRFTHLRAETPATSMVYLHDPLPGVHMVYMYANGSDPGISGPRAEFGGPSNGEHHCVAVWQVAMSSICE
jgi:hypothetical protein